MQKGKMRSMSEYKPPFHITDKIINLVADISEQIGRINVYSHGNMNPHLRKANRIQTIHSPICRWKRTYGKNVAQYASWKMECIVLLATN